MEPLLACVRQAAAIPLRNGRVCLVRSRSGKRWVVPKGRIEAGQSAAETALQEAWEEAGLAGLLGPQPVGSYLYDKGGRSHHVTVYVLEVTAAASAWPEDDRRPRRWLLPEQALGLVQKAGLRQVLRQVLAAETLTAAG